MTYVLYKDIDMILDIFIYLFIYSGNNINKYIGYIYELLSNWEDWKIQD